MIDRRAFLGTLTGSLLGGPLAAEAQRAGKVYRIAIVFPASNTVAAIRQSGAYQLILSELRQRDYVEGKNLAVHPWAGEGRTALYRDLARKVVESKPDVIFAVSIRFVSHLKEATRAIPIVAVAADPVAAGLVASLVRPGGNITGVSTSTGQELHGKHLELLKEAVPTASRIALLVPRGVWESWYTGPMREAAQRLGVTLVGALLEDPIQGPEYRRVFGGLTRDRVNAVIVGDTTENYSHTGVIVNLAAQARLPTLAVYKEFVEAGGLMAHAIDLPDLFRIASGHIYQILRGANPGDLPFHQPTRLELVINLKTAKALGLTIPPSLLQRADHVIE